MKEDVDIHRFIEAFRDLDREESFTREGFKSLYEYLTEYEDSTGQELEVDPIAYDCDFTEYADLSEFHENYDKENYPDMESIQDVTTVISVNDDAFIIQNF